MKISFTLDKKNIKVFILSFFAFNLLFSTLVPDSFQKLINVLGIALSFFIALILIPRLNTSHQEIIVIFLLSFFLCGALYSTYQARFDYFQMDSWQAGIYYVLRILSFFVLVYYVVKMGNGTELARNFYVIALIYCLVNDILLIPRMAVLRGTQGYLLGNKFDVSYMHLKALFLYIFQNELTTYGSKNTKLLVLYTLIISWMVDCITGIMGVLFFCLFYFALPKKLIKKPVLWIAISVMSFISVFNYNYIVGTKIYQNFFLGSLDRGVTLTGRINIYKKLPSIMSGHWLWGYGPNSSFDVIHNYLNMPNTQNGFWDIILQVGAISFLFLALLIIYSIYRVDKKNQDFLIALIAMLDTYSVLAIFEITVSFSFIGCAILIAIYSSLQKNKGKEQDIC